MGAIQFDGTDDYLERTASVPVGAHPLTIAAWFKSTASTTEKPLAAIVQSGAATRRIGMGVRTVDSGSNYVSAYAQDDFGNFDAATANFGTDVRNTWRSGVATFNSTRDSRLAYRDATAGSANTAALNTNWLTFTEALSVGRSGGTVPAGYFAGYLAYLFIWDIELSGADVTSWHGGTIVQEADLLAAYDFTVDAVGGVYADQVGSFDLTVNGATFNSGETYTGQTYSFGGGDTPLDAQPGSFAFTGAQAALEHVISDSPVTLRVSRSNLRLS
jgi:hypothetical protein